MSMVYADRIGIQVGIAWIKGQKWKSRRFTDRIVSSRMEHEVHIIIRLKSGAVVLSLEPKLLWKCWK